MLLRRLVRLYLWLLLCSVWSQALVDHFLELLRLDPLHVGLFALCLELGEEFFHRERTVHKLEIGNQNKGIRDYRVTEMSLQQFSTTFPIVHLSL